MRPWPLERRSPTLTNVAIHPPLEAGVGAYHGRRFQEAAASWRREAAEADGDEGRALAALAAFAEALCAAEAGSQEEADDRYAVARLELEELPDRLLGIDLVRLRRRLPARVEAALASPPELPVARRLPRKALLRFAIFLALLAAAAAAARWTPLRDLLSREVLLATLGRLREAWWSPLLLVGLYALLCPIGLPATPLMLAGAVVFGAVWGSVYNFTGLFVGGVAGYLVARFFGAELLRHFAGGKLRKVERLLTRHGVWYLISIRFLPLPYPAVNFGMALAGIRFLPFAVSTAVALLFTTTVWTYFYAALYAAAAGEAGGILRRVALAMGLLLTVSLLPAALARRARARRFRDLKQRRRRQGR